jgi:anti-sigma-K factor RskA
MSGCPHRDDAGPWVLHALADEDARAFAEHLRGCDECRREVAELQVVADALPMAAPQVSPPPELKGRIMDVVRSEAERAPRARRRLWPTLRLRPLPAVGLACAILAVGIAGGVLVSSGGGGGAQTFQAQAPRGADVTVRVEDGRASLDVRGMPAPPPGRGYHVWLARGNGRPRPTHALWVPRQGRATVDVPERVGDADTVMVTAEPMGGSDAPTSAPVVRASIA